MNLPDYSDFLKKPGMLEYIESEWKRNIQIHKNHSEFINPFIKDKTVIEIGCSTGNLAQFLECKEYLGFDKNEESIQIAFNKTDKVFKVGDIRYIRKTKNQNADVVIGMAIMKHFGLHEWDEIMKKMINLANEMVIFDMPVAEYTYDDGEKHGHYHVWMTNEDLMNRLEYLGLDVYDTNFSNPVEPIFACLKK